MLPPTALASWARKQRELLSTFYDDAWARGVAAYVPDDDPEDGSEPLTAAEREHARLNAQSAVAATLARRYLPYVAPKYPNPDRKRQALAKPLRSIDKMIGEVTAVNTSPDLAPGSKREPGRSSAAAIAAWATSNSFRLAMGAGAVWAAEQHGFAQAASADGQLLIWICVEDDASCQDCLDMAEMPPAAEQDWAVLPGDGGTSCGGNCRCTMDYSSSPGR